MKPTKKGNIAFASGYNRIKATKYGYMMYNSHDIYVGGSFENYGQFSDDEVQFVLSHLSSDSIVLDIGANYGALTIPIAQKVKEVVAFEPQRPAFYALAANCALNSLENVVLENSALANYSGHITVPKLDFSKANNIGGLSMGVGEGYKVKCTTLDNVASTLNIQKASFIKMDVEGMELPVLKGGKEFIMSSRPLMYVEADRPDKIQALHDYIVSDLNYEVVWHRPMLFTENNFFGKKENIWNKPIASHNLFCTPM